MGQSVVVAVDGTQGALDAVAWAAREAALRRQPLRLVHAFTGRRRLRARAYQILDEAVYTARNVAAATDVRVSFEVASSVALLRRESRAASVLVLGLETSGRLAGRTFGSTIEELTVKAHAPLVVVPGVPAPERRTNAVVVGADSSAAGAAAIEAAFEAAGLRRLPLIAVSVHGSGSAGPYPHDERGDQLRSVLECARHRHPDVAVERTVTTEHPGPTVATLAERAALVVLGGDEIGAARRSVLGSVSNAVVRRGRCPVMLLPRALVARQPKAPERREESSAVDPVPPGGV